MLTNSDIKENVILTIEYTNPTTEKDETHVVTVTSVTNEVIRIQGFFKTDGKSLYRNTTKQSLISTARLATPDEVEFFQACYEKKFSTKHISVILNKKVEKSLSISSTIYEIEAALKNKSIKEIAKEMRIGASKLRQILTIVGYEYDSGTRKWRYILADDSDDQRHRTFWHVDHYGMGNTGNIDNEDASSEEGVDENISNTGNISAQFEVERNDNTSNIGNIESQSEKEADDNMSNLSNIGNTEAFTTDEIAILKQLAARHSNDVDVADSTDVLQALKKAPTGSTSKKTFALNDDIINQLDTFCDVHRVKKSDVLAVALQDFFEKYQ